MNELFGAPLSKMELVPAGLVSEAYVSGYHADNIAPAIMGGFVLVRCALGKKIAGRLRLSNDVSCLEQTMMRNR